MTPSHLFTRLFHPTYLKAPKGVSALDISALMGDAPLYFEIGAGKGKHALLFAKENPHARLIAVERTHEKFGAFDKQFDAYKPANLTAIHADAIAFCVHFIAPHSLDGVFILYPNPEPHNKNQRWLNMPFFEFLLSRLKAGASIALVSNIASYIDEAADLLTDVWQLPFSVSDVPASSARTHFEIKYLARAEHCQEISITKPAGYRTRFDEMAALSMSHD